MNTQEPTPFKSPQCHNLKQLREPEGNTAETIIPTMSLPCYQHMNKPNFMWGTLNGTSFSRAINSAYYEAICWRHNLFQVPWGKVGTSFVTGLASLFRGYGESTVLESVALHAAMVMPILLLQKPHARSKAKDHLKCLERRLAVWKAGDIELLFHEGRTIQSRFRLPHTNSSANEDHITNNP